MRRHDLDAKVAEEAHALDDAAPEVVRVLADPAGERERVDATARRGHRGDGARNAVHVDLECERRRLAHIAGPAAGQTGETGLVSTERPSRTAVTELPPPRWQTTSRGTCTCCETHCTEMPWNP